MIICGLTLLSFAGGIYPPITTPFNQDESISWAHLKTNLEQFNKTNLKGYLVQGSNGEYCYMTSSERIEMIKKVMILAIFIIQHSLNARPTCFCFRKNGLNSQVFC